MAKLRARVARKTMISKASAMVVTEEALREVAVRRGARVENLSDLGGELAHYYWSLGVSEGTNSVVCNKGFIRSLV